MPAIEQRQAVALADLQQAAKLIGGRVTQRAYTRVMTGGTPARTIARLWPGGWREALREAGLVTVVHTDALMLTQLARAVQDNGGSPLTAREINARDDLPSASLYLLRFGSLNDAHIAAGAPAGDDLASSERIIADGLKLAELLGRLPTWQDWRCARAGGRPLASEWQVWRRFGGRQGAWRMFHYHLLETAGERGVRLPVSVG